MLEESDPAHALFDSHRWRPADHDGATRPLRSAVLLLRLEDQIPETHLLRLIDKHISFAFVGEKLKESYSDTGRPSIDPELLLRIVLIGYLYGITSERKLIEELRMDLAWRWFTGPRIRSGDSASLHVLEESSRTFSGSKVFEQLFEEIVARCLEAGLVQGHNLSVDGSFVEANASKMHAQLLDVTPYMRTRDSAPTPISHK
jgi:transposase